VIGDCAVGSLFVIAVIRASVISGSMIGVKVIGCTDGTAPVPTSPSCVGGTSVSCSGGLGVAGCTIRKLREVKIVRDSAL
jgi:hypothetical protein